MVYSCGRSCGSLPLLFLFPIFLLEMESFSNLCMSSIHIRHGTRIWHAYWSSITDFESSVSDGVVSILPPNSWSYKSPVLGDSVKVLMYQQICPLPSHWWTGRPVKISKPLRNGSKGSTASLLKNFVEKSYRARSLGLRFRERYATKKMREVGRKFSACNIFSMYKVSDAFKPRIMQSRCCRKRKFVLVLDEVRSMQNASSLVVSGWW